MAHCVELLVSEQSNCNKFQWYVTI